jgi:uncharacterized membrane protein
MHSVSRVLLEILRARLWVVPTVAAVLAAAAAAVVLLIDPGTAADRGLVAVDASSARYVLSTISGAMISFTALVFSITMLVLQQAAAQLSPRVMRTFLRDRFSQTMLGLLVATFVFALLILLTIGADSVSGLGVAVAVGLVLASILAFVAYIDHMAHAIRPTSVIRSIGQETREAIDRNDPGDGPVRGGLGDAALGERDPGRGEERGRVLPWPGDSGYIRAYDQDQLRDMAERSGRSLTLYLDVGSYLVHGSRFLTMEDAEGVASPEPDRLATVAQVGPERTMSQDPAFGFRQLVDIALRALSPSLNDPTTAVQVIDELHALLRHLLERPLPSPRILAVAGGSVVRVPAPDWDAFVHAAVDEIADAGRAHAVVGRRILQLLDDLERDCPDDRRPALRRAHDAVEAVMRPAMESPTGGGASA